MPVESTLYFGPGAPFAGCCDREGATHLPIKHPAYTRPAFFTFAPAARTL